MQLAVWTRRDFLSRAAAISALAWLTAPVEAAYMLFAPTDLLSQDLDALRDAKGSAVRILTRNGATVSARIHDIVEYAKPSLGSPFHQYSILFETAGEPQFWQDVHRVEHARLGAAELLLVPVVHAGMKPTQLAFSIGQSTMYEAVITRRAAG